MHSLTKKYNRSYYRSVVKIQARKYWKLFKLYIASFLVKLAHKICSDFFEEYDKFIIEKYERIRRG